MTLDNWLELDNWTHVLAYPFHMWARYIAICFRQLPQRFAPATSAVATTRDVYLQYSVFQLLCERAASWKTFGHFNS